MADKAMEVATMARAAQSPAGAVPGSVLLLEPGQHNRASGQLPNLDEHYHPI